MPTYEYKCNACLWSFELRKRFEENPQAACPWCGGDAHRIFSPVPIVFKGPGFYVTDNASRPSSRLDDHGEGNKPVVGASKCTGLAGTERDGA